MAKEVKYKKPIFNIVAIAIALILAIVGYLGWVFLPLKLRESEVVRVLDEVSSEFLGQAARSIAVKDEQKRMLNKMRGKIQEVGVQDPQMEAWIEIDNENQVRFGVLYADRVKLIGMGECEKLHEVEMTCTRLGKGHGWTCTTADLLSEAGDQLAGEEPADSGATRKCPL